MSGETQRKRRVVSRREYVFLRSKRIALSSLGILLLMTCLCLFVFVTIDRLNTDFAYYADVRENAHARMGVAEQIIKSVFLCGVLLWLAGRVFRKVQVIENVVPLTRHNIGDLPEGDTLVRASEEPPAQQADVLLRAAQGSLEIQEEQLLRPVSE